LKEQYPERSPWEDLDYNTSSKSPEKQELTVINQRKEWLAKISDGKLPTNHKTEGGEEVNGNLLLRTCLVDKTLLQTPAIKFLSLRMQTDSY